jgi:CO dehydrogenase flavoprotein C-terminal domain
MDVVLSQGSCVHDAAGTWVAEEVELAFGGVAPKAIMAPKTEQALQGKVWDEPLLRAALETLAEDINITPNAPGACVSMHGRKRGDELSCTSAVSPPGAHRSSGAILSLRPLSSMKLVIGHLSYLEAHTVHTGQASTAKSATGHELTAPRSRCAGGMVEFRRSLAASFLFRFVVHANYALAVRSLTHARAAQSHQQNHQLRTASTVSDRGLQATIAASH